MSILDYMNLPDSVDVEYIWERDHGIFELKENSVCFVCFYLDPYCEDLSAVITEIYDRLISDELDPWLKNYIWSNTILHTEIRHDHNTHYIFGSLEFGDNLPDEWLITSILYNFSSRYRDLYIHIFDNEGEFLFIELADDIPEFLDINCGLNRPWINNKQLLIIPNECHPNRNLSLSESLKFLQNFNFKLLRNEILDEKLQDVLKEYPQKALENIFSVKVEISEDVALVLCNNHRSLSSLCIQESIGNTTPEEEQGTAVPKLKKILLDVQVTTLCYLNLVTADILGNSSIIGWHLQNGLSKLKKIGMDIKEGVAPLSKESIDKFESDELQIELKAQSKIKDFVVRKFKFEVDEPPQKVQDIDEKELINRLKEVFESSSTFEGIGNFNETYNNDSDYSSDAEDEKVKKFLRDEKVDIDEDDFFEFFCKEALKLKDEDLEHMRHSKGLYEDESISDDDIVEDDEDDSEGDDVDIDQELIQDLLKALSMEQGTGPMSTLFNSFK